MNEYIFLMHNDATDSEIAADGERWATYMALLRASGQFDGGSSIGSGERLRLDHASEPADGAVTGFMRVRAESLIEAKRLLAGNPTYEAGGTVEIRELTRD